MNDHDDASLDNVAASDDVADPDDVAAHDNGAPHDVVVVQYDDTMTTPPMMSWSLTMTATNCDLGRKTTKDESTLPQCLKCSMVVMIY
jgi:hypothetical protein